tara:strand:+ start:1117 stop:1323 length:207 start_codon:yes stop_codon:yes gene_type:complete
MKKLTIIFLSYYALLGVLLNFGPAAISSKLKSDAVLTVLGLLFMFWAFVGFYKTIAYFVVEPGRKQNQ